MKSVRLRSKGILFAVFGILISLVILVTSSYVDSNRLFVLSILYGCFGIISLISYHQEIHKYIQQAAIFKRKELEQMFEKKTNTELEHSKALELRKPILILLQNDKISEAIHLGLNECKVNQLHETHSRFVEVSSLYKSSSKKFHAGTITDEQYNQKKKEVVDVILNEILVS